MKKAVILILSFFSLSAFSQLLKPYSGSVRRFENFPSKYIDPRNVDVWLPASYDSTKKYATLYMHDGVMLFDSAITWNHQEWMVDETMTRLLLEKKIKDCIVIGIWYNGSYRFSEYFPQKALDYIPTVRRNTLIKEELADKPQADNYLLFLTKELKPFIDTHFSTKDDQQNTFIAGSSMGGLISLYAICEYPEIFGGAACMSTHWPGSLKDSNNIIPNAFNSYLKESLPDPENHKIYFDYGTKTLDSTYKPYQLAIDTTMRKAGYTSSNWVTKEFVGEDHSERSWSKRFYLPLLFLLSKN